MPTNTVYDPGTEERPATSSENANGALDASALNAAESDVSSPTDNSNEGSDTGDGESQSLYNSKDGAAGRFARTKSSLSKFSKNRLLVGGALAGGSGLIVMILLGILILGSLKIPNLSTHIIGYEFSRVSRQMAENSSRVAAEEVGVASANDSAWSRLTEKYSTVRDKTYGPMVDKVNKYRPGKVYEKLQTSNRIGFKYEPRRTILNGKINVGTKITALVVDGKEIPVNSSGWKRLIHPVQGFQSSVEFSTSLNSSMVEALPSTNFIVRGFVARAYAKSAGLRYQWYNPKTYAGTTEAKARALLEKESAQRISGEAPVGSSVEKVTNATQEVEKMNTACLDNETCVNKLVAANGVNAQVDATIAKSFQDTLGDKIVGALSPLGVLVPACIIYDGSLNSTTAAQVIDRKSSADMKAFMAVSSAADQQKAGDVNGESVGAMNWKVGQIEKSNAEIRTSGKVVDTSQDDQPQASATGEFTSIAGSLPGPLAYFVDTIAQPACPLLSSFEFNVAAGLLGVAATVFTGPTYKAATGAAGEGIKILIQNYTKHLVESLLVKKTYVAGAKLGVKTGANAAAIVGLTVLAQNIVHNKVAATDTALSTDATFTNSSDAGANLYANQLSRLHYGRPLRCSEVDALRSADNSYQTAVAGNKSSYDRYLALSNPDSLVTHVGMAAAIQMNSGIVNNLLRIASQVFTPSGAILGVMGLGHPAVTHAAPGNCVDTQDYGVVQWGMAPDEERLVNSDPSYKPLENQRILDSRDYCSKWSSVRGCLERSFYTDQPMLGQYNACFGYNSSGALDGTATMGWMLARNQGGFAPVLGRDKSGNITDLNKEAINVAKHTDVYPNETITTIDSIGLQTDEAFCSPDKLGINNTDVIPGPGNGTVGDLVFRYRVEKNYEMTMDQLLNVQNAGEQTGVQ